MTTLKLIRAQRGPWTGWTVVRQWYTDRNLVTTYVTPDGGEAMYLHKAVWFHSHTDAELFLAAYELAKL